MQASGNALVVGPPRSGKTTALERTVALLREAGHSVGGVSCPEIREEGDRVGFEVVDLAGGDRAVLAHREFEDGPSVGSYRVDADVVDRLAGDAIANARIDADCVVIDEIAPMQLESDRFVRETRLALEDSVPVLASIAEGPRDGFVGEVRSRDDVEVFAVTPDSRDELPERLFERVRVR